MDVYSVIRDEHNTLDNSSDNIPFDQKFYQPLCLTGYLTPLQRKKLREKRNLLFDNILDTRKPPEAKIPRGVKRKKDASTKMPTKKPSKKKRTHENFPQIQCSASKIVLKTNKDDKVKKFFKTSSHNRLEKANFTMSLVFNKNTFLNIDKCVKRSISSCEKDYNTNLPKSTDVVEVIESKNVSQDNAGNVCKIISSSKTDALKNSVATNYREVRNKDIPVEKSVFDFDWPSEEHLLRRQERARAALRNLNCSKEWNEAAPQKQNNSGEQSSIEAQPVKLYPIFYTSPKQKKGKEDVKRMPKRWCVVGRRRGGGMMIGGGEQMMIDAGQKDVGAKICSTCNMLYTQSQEEDEKLHRNYHDTYLVNLKFHGWRDEKVMGEYDDGRVIMVRKEDKSHKLKKIEDVLFIANRDLGFPSSVLPLKPDLTFVLFISSDKQVVGCLVAEPISSACEIVSSEKENAEKSGSWFCGRERVSAILGINRIWVAHSFRHNKVASRMIDCLRCHFVHGHVVGLRELAFTDPTPSGRAFATAYTGTENFLIYN